MWGSFLIYLWLILTYVFFIFNLSPIEVNLMVSEANLPNRITEGENSYINFQNNINKAEYKSIEVYKRDTENTWSVNGLLLSLDWNVEKKLFIPKKEELGNYTILNFDWDDLKIERIDSQSWFISIPSGPIIGSYVYSGSSLSWTLLNSITDSTICTYDSATSTCN